MDFGLNSADTWFSNKREEWKKFDAWEAFTGSVADTLPSSDGSQLKFPRQLLVPLEKQEKTGKDDDPFSFLGPIGYTMNSFRGRKDRLWKIHNLYSGGHVKKTVMLELARRLILAESLGGLPSDIDDDSLVGDGDLHFDRE